MLRPRVFVSRELSVSRGIMMPMTEMGAERDKPGADAFMNR